MINIRELLNDFQKAGYTFEEREKEKVGSHTRKFPPNYTRYELFLYRDIRGEDGWETTQFKIMTTTSIDNIKKIIPNAEELLKKEELKKQ